MVKRYAGQTEGLHLSLSIERNTSNFFNNQTNRKPKGILHAFSYSLMQNLQLSCRYILDMAKLSVKGLIESSLKAGHTLDSDHQRLEQFFIIIEYVLRHGLKSNCLVYCVSLLILTVAHKLQI